MSSHGSEEIDWFPKDKMAYLKCYIKGFMKHQLYSHVYYNIREYNATT